MQKTYLTHLSETNCIIIIMMMCIFIKDASPLSYGIFTSPHLVLCFNFNGNDTSKAYVNINSATTPNCNTHFSSGGGGISCIGVVVGVFSISIIANGASGSGSGDTELSIGAASPVAGSAAFPALLPNLTAFHKLFQSK